MNKEIRIVNKEKSIMQITTIDERWYAFPSENKTTGLPEYKFIPSATWIASYYPKGVAFYQWLASKGWEEAEAIKIAAGNRGSHVHLGCEIIEEQGSLSIDYCFKNEETQFLEPMTTEEIICLQSFTKWWNDTKPELLASEMTVLGGYYAGTLDRIYRINGQIWIVDFKTSKSIWEEQKLQVSSYKHANINFAEFGITADEWAARKVGILQLGYTLNKNGYKFTEIDDKYDLFQIAYRIWQNENPNAKPKQKDLPLMLTINKIDVVKEPETATIEPKDIVLNQGDTNAQH